MFEEQMETMMLVRADDKGAYFAFLLVTTLLAIVFIFYWTPFLAALGFADGPTSPVRRTIALAMIVTSGFITVPALLIGQIASPILWLFDRTRAAYLVPLLCMSSFLLCVVAVILLW